MWIHTDIYFHNRLKSFRVNSRKLFSYTGIRKVFESLDPCLISSKLKEVVIQSRPGLKDCAILGFSTIVQEMASHILVSHPLFREIKVCDLPPEVYLDPCYICHRDIPVEEPTCLHFVPAQDSSFQAEAKTCCAACDRKLKGTSDN